MKTNRTPKNTSYRAAALTLAVTAAIGAAGVMTTAVASPGKLKTSSASAFTPGAAERKAAELPRAWRLEGKTVSYDAMFAG